MKFNLYIPHPSVIDRWQLYADMSGMSLSNFIRQAVEEKIQRLLKDKDFH